jgi:hypothetical protein
MLGNKCKKKVETQVILQAISLVTVALLYLIVLSTRVDGGLDETKTASADGGPEPGPLGSDRRK